MKYLINRALLFLEKKGYGIIHPSQYKSDMEKEFLEIWEKTKQYTMISIERGYNIFKSVEYVVKNNISGDFVECGVWKGGACMIMAESLLRLGKQDRKIVLYDTFSGMTEPDENDCISWTGKNMKERWKKSKDNEGNYLWAAGINEVRRNMLSVGYPENMVEFHIGDVCKTLDNGTPQSISLLRLDTDWYESTKKELEILYPLLNKNGVLIIDDYGHFTGAKKAVDEYFSNKTKIYLSRIDYTGRVGIKL
ncbi:MAG: TylF/MycF family methyltransferase [Spirochaetaceae bacterium]|nr:TylF/MycF family methyltransferase [Spirochaetaceae bacterium]